MAFSFASVAADVAGMGGSQQSGLQVQDGDDLQEITTGQLGFMTVNGEVKIKLLPSPWPAEDLPIPSAQLLSVASSQGILAAAGPEHLVIVSTDEIRRVLQEKEGENVRAVQPLLSIPHTRLSHVAFSSDESVLVASSQTHGGFIVYQADKLKQGHSQPALQLPSMGVGLRALVPNPNPQAAHLFAAIDADGGLLMADLSAGQLVTGPEGNVLQKNVSCLSWSNRGKQLLAGSVDGTAIQMKPDGTSVARIPKSTSISDSAHVSGISWLEDDSFFIIYTPNEIGAADGIPPSEYYIVERQNKTNFTFKKLPEILPPFGMERLPTFHFISRLRKFDPHITDLLLLSATTATDIGILSKTSSPLNPQEPVVNAFTLTSIDDDTRRAALPLSESSLDTSPIGMAVDLSSTEPVINPIPSNPEIQETAGPAPNLLVLNNEGILCSWWIIYNESVEQKTVYSGFNSLKKVEEVRSAASPPSDTVASPISSESANTSTAAKPANASPFAAPTLTGTSSIFGNSTPNLSSSNPVSQIQPSTGFGTGSSFSNAPKIGENKSSWTSTGFGGGNTSSGSDSAFNKPGFGQTAFGTPSALGSKDSPAFGSTSALGGQPTVFGQSAFSTPAFGSTGFGSNNSASKFGTTPSGDTKSGSGFASFANSGGFGFGAGTNKQDENKGSPFAKSTTDTGFGQSPNAGSSFTSNPNRSAFNEATSSDSPFAKATGSSAFGQGTVSPFGKSQGFGGFGASTNNTNTTGFGSGTPFKIGSSFKGDGTAKDDLPPPSNGGGFGFGSGFGNMLGEAKKSVSPTQNTEAEMDDNQDDDDTSADEKERPFAGFSPQQIKEKTETTKPFTTPPSTITQPKTTPAPPLSNLFGPPQQQTTTPQQGFGGQFSFSSTTPKETPAASRTLFGTNPISQPTPAVVQKSEPVQIFGTTPAVQTPESKSEPSGKKADGAPKIVTESPSDDGTVNITKITEPPLPPDATSKPGYTTGDTSASSANSKGQEDAPLPPDFLPANKSATEEAEGAELPSDEDDGEDEGFSSDFEDSGEDVTQDMSPVDEHSRDHEEDTTIENIQTSPESSFKADDTTSPTGGLFTKISTNDTSKLTRPLFGEVGRNAPVFPPPSSKVQQSPRSPSPVRQLLPHDTLRPDSRSVSAPVRPRSAIDQRKAEYSQSAIAAQAIKAREEEAAREKTRLEALKLAREQEKAHELQRLEDDEDERIQKELALPIEPSEDLDSFIAYQTRTNAEGSKADIPAQIERLFQDINSMIYTLGINARSLSAFLMHHRDQSTNPHWPKVLQSETPFDALNDQWFLTDIDRLHEGSVVLEKSLEQSQVYGVPQKLEKCQILLTKDLVDLRTKITSVRKSIHARAYNHGAMAPLSAEQASIQHDLRKASASVQTKLVEVEDTLALMRARLAETAPSETTNKRQSMLGGQAIQKKPTVEAVTNTIIKMTSMAEKKSADIDVLESQLRKLDSSLGASITHDSTSAEPATPRRQKISRIGGTPTSATSSLFYTPESKLGGSTRSSRSVNGHAISMAMISTEDKERWQAKAKKRREVAAILKSVLEEKSRNVVSAG